LTATPGLRNVTMTVDGVSVNDTGMDDQSFAFSHGPAFFILSGNVDIREVAAGAVDPAGTEVRFTEVGAVVRDTTTDATGAFSFLVETSMSGKLDLVRDFDPAPSRADKALNIADVQAPFRIVAGVPGLFAQGDDWIAGDVNQNGATNIADVQALFLHVAWVPGTPPPEYVFVDAADDLSGTISSSVPLPIANFDVAPMVGDMDMSFLGILGGDLNGQI